jgi:hypothetical protein
LEEVPLNIPDAVPRVRPVAVVHAQQSLQGKPENPYEAKPVFAALELSFADAVCDEQPLMLLVPFGVDETTGIDDGRLYLRVCATFPCRAQHRICLDWRADHGLPGW